MSHSAWVNYQRELTLPRLTSAPIAVVPWVRLFAGCWHQQLHEAKTPKRTSSAFFVNTAVSVVAGQGPGVLSLRLPAHPMGGVGPAAGADGAQPRRDLRRHLPRHQHLPLPPR